VGTRSVSRERSDIDQHEGNTIRLIARCRCVSERPPQAFHFTFRLRISSLSVPN